MTVSVDAPTTIDLVGRPALDPNRVLTTVTAVRGSEVFTAQEPGRSRLGSEVVALPVTGERVVGIEGEEGARVYWLGLVQEPIGAFVAADGVLTVYLLIGGAVREVKVQPGIVDARRTVTGRASEDERAAMDALLTEARAHHCTRTEHNRRMDHLVAEAHQEADEQEWCEQFDDFMARNGLPRRTRSYDLRVTVSATLYVQRDAASAEAALESLDRADVLAVLGHDDFEWEAEEDC